MNFSPRSNFVSQARRERMPITRPRVVSKIYLLAHETRIRAYLESPVTKSILYRSKSGLVKAKDLLDPELRIRVTLAKMFAQKNSREFSKYQPLSVSKIEFLLL